MKHIKCDCETNNVGSARILSGRIYTLCFFISYEGKPWTIKGIEKAVSDLYKAEDWLVEQAARYSSHIEFVNECYGLDCDLYVKHIPDFSLNNSYNFPKSIILKLGYNSFDEFLDWEQHHARCDQYINLVFANIQGRSYACPVTKSLNTNNPHEFTVEACLLYDYYYKWDAEYNSSVYAHEILHLFGAWDLYKLNKRDKKRAEMAAEYFPRSIMIDTYDKISNYEIDSLTAWLVGISDMAEEWYPWFDPSRNIMY